MFLHLGQVKSDFAAYHPEKNPDGLNFYKGSIISGIFKVNKKIDANGKIKVKETKKKCLQMIIKMQYGTVTHFCELYDIDELFFTAYLSGADGQIKYLDTATSNIVTTQMYIDGYQVKLVSDTSYGSLWEVSFTLKEF